MSVRRKLTVILPGVLLLCGIAATAAEDELPDMAFLEYLGMWQESDDEWLALEDDSDRLVTDSGERIDPVLQGKESTEKDDED